MIYKHVSRLPKSRSTVTVGELGPKRDMTYLYKLNNSEGVEQHVCKSFFLKTLGYHEKNDRIISTVMKSTPVTDISAKQDARGHHPNATKIDRDPIIDHINTFNPTISHYRREHAPNRRYLPSDITIAFMHSDYNSKHPDDTIGIETYRRTVSDMKISFAKLGEEECERCIRQEEHVKIINHTGEVHCLDCDNWQIHKENANSARIHYQADSSQELPADSRVISADLQKVIMLPRMPGNKTSIFTKRIVAFHETFATVGMKQKGKNKENSTSVIWHEGIAGRKAEEITSSFVTALEKYRDKKHIIIWLDNCSAQNKNWCLLTTLTSLINNDTIEFDDISLKFFESGHTFMSADSFHHGVELEMKRRNGGKIYDFAEFHDVVGKSNSGNVDVIAMDNSQVRAYKAGQAQSKLKKASVTLSSMKVIQLRRGSMKLFYKTSHDDAEFQPLDFLKKTFELVKPPQLREVGRGIPAAKKADIVTKLCPMMPASRRNFWQSVLVDDTVGDVIEG